MTLMKHDATYSGRLAHAVCGLTLDDVPAPVLAVAKAHLLDALGLALASTGMDYGRAVHEAALRLGCSEQSRALGFGSALPAASSALVNGTLIHGLDFDDTHIGAIYHATAPSLATALAVGEAEDADGATVLLAYVVGLEVGCRLAAAFHRRGFHPTGIVGAFAAVCVAATIRGCTPEVLINALGLCGSQAAGILELHESWLKRMHPGWAAHSGIVAVTMAEAGFRGPATVLEGPGGLFASHLGQVPAAEALGLDDLGSRWMTADIALKPYPCCHFTHAFVDAAAGLLATMGVERLTLADVRSIECPTAPELMPMVTEPVEVKTAPQTIYDALFSVQFVVANVLLGRPIDLGTFYDAPLDDPEVLALAALVTCTPDDGTDFPRVFPGEVVLHLQDGRTLRRQVTSSHGTPGDPLSDSEVLTKFLGTAGRAVSREQAERIADLVGRLDSLSHIGELVDACVVPAIRA